MPSRLGYGLYKKIDRLKNFFRFICIGYIPGLHHEVEVSTGF